MSVQIRFKSGATKSLTLPRQKTAWQLRQTPGQVVDEIDRLLDQYTDGQISEKLNVQGLRSGKGEHFNSRMVAKVRRHYNLKSRYDRLRETGLLTQQEIAQELDITEQNVKIWRNDGRLHGLVYNDKKQCLYESIVKSSADKYQR